MKLSESLESLAIWWMDGVNDGGTGGAIDAAERPALSHMIKEYNDPQSKHYYWFNGSNEFQALLCLFEAELQRDEEQTRLQFDISIA